MATTQGLQTTKIWRPDPASRPPGQPMCQGEVVAGKISVDGRMCCLGDGRYCPIDLAGLQPHVLALPSGMSGLFPD